MMAQSKDKEFQNFSKTGRLLRDIGATTVKKKLKSCFPSFDFQDILAKNRHNLYHLWNDQKCCRCVYDDLSGHAPVLDDVQWNSLFTSHPPVCRNVCSCSYTPVSGKTIDSLDLTLTMRIIENVASLNPGEKAYLRGIDKTRCLLDNACSTFRLSDADFGHHWSALTLNIAQLAGTCGPGDQKNVEMKIETLKSADNPFKDNAEAENYYRCDTLITNVGSAVLRDKFMDQFPNQTFEDILNNNIHSIYNLRKGRINCSCGQRALRSRNKPLFDSQWNLLFSQLPSTSYSSTDCRSYSAIQCVNVDHMDVTLISCLLLNIANLNDNEKKLVKKIREAKNNLKSHNTEAKLSDTDFEQQWNNVSQNIENLAKTCGSKLLSCPQYVDNMHREIETLKTRVLDISFVKAISKQSKEFRPQLNILEGKTSDILDKIQSLETNLGKHRDQLTREIEISESIIKRTVGKTKFVRTRAFKFAAEQITHNKQFVMFIGLPGDGKTAHAIHLMQEVKNGGNFHKTSKHPFIIADQSDVEMLNLISLHGNLVVLIDDMFGRYNASPQTVRKWQKYYGKLEVWFADPLKSSCNYLIATMRKDIFNSCETSLKTLEIYKTGIIIDMTSSDLCLDFAEKKSIVRAIISEALISDSQIQNVCKENKHLGFPQCCRMFSNNTKFHNSVESFFQNPVAYLQSDLKMMFDGLEEERLRFCGLALIVFHGGCLHERYCYEQNCSEQDVERLQNSTLICGIRYSKEIGNKLIDNLKSFARVYVESNEQKSEYTFSHSSYEQAIVNLMFERNTELMIRSCAFSHLVRPGTFSPKEFHYKMIVERISKELNIQRHAVFCNLADMDMWGDDIFKRKVTDTFNSEDFGLHYHMQDGRNDNISLLVCGASSGNLCLVQFLMKFSPSNNQMERALDIAGRNGREEVFNFLLEKGVEAKVKTLCEIIKSGNINLFKGVLEKTIGNYAKDVPKTSVFQDICKAGNKVMAEVFLSHFPNFLESNPVDILLCISGSSGSLKFVRYIQELGTTLKIGSFGKHRQDLPCVTKSLDLVKYMLENLSFPLHIVYNGWTNLHFACHGGSVDTVQYLIERGLNVKEVTSNRESVLHIACSKCHFDLVQYLVEECPSLLQMVDKDGFSNLHKASLGGSVDVVKYLIAKGEKVTDVNTGKESVLHLACRECHFDLVQYLVEEYPSLLQLVDNDGYSNLHNASLGGSVDVVKYLIPKGEKVTDVTSDNRSMLHIACRKCHFDLVQYLVEEYPSLLQMVDNDGYSNLQNASLGGSVDVVKYLIAKGEKITDVNSRKESVLHLACRECHFDLVQYLAEEYPSLLQMVDNDGFSNLHNASLGGSVDVVKYLIAKGDKVTDVNTGKESVLHLACKKCHFDLVQYLVEEYPSLLQMVDNYGFSNLHNASFGGSVDVVKYLIAKGEKVTYVTSDKRSMLHLACRKCHFDLVQYLVEIYPSLLQMVDNDGYSNLHNASLGGSVDVVKYLIGKGEKVTDVTTNKESELHIACRKCHFDLVQYLVEECPSLLQMVDKDGFSNLHKASLGGSVDVVKYLIAKGEKVTDVNTGKESVLHLACRKCHFDLVQYLVEEYPSLLQLVDNDGFSNLHNASLGGSVDVVKYLIPKGEKVTDVTSDNRSMLHIACRKCHFDLVQYLVEEYPSLLQMVDNDGYSNLHNASLGGSVDVVKYLIAKGEKITDVNSRKESVLHLACSECHFDLVQYLAEEYPSLLQMVDNDGFSNLHHASLGGSVDVVKYLIAKGEKVTDVNTEKESVLHLACKKCHFDLVQYLVEEYPSLLQMVDNDGFSNLHNASFGGSVDVVKYLIAKGEKVTDVTSDKRSILHIACMECHLDLVQYLVDEYPSLLQMVDNDGFSNLHNASHGGSVDVVKYLIAKGEKITDVNSRKESVLHIACSECHFDLVQYLVEEYPSLLQMVDNDGFSNLYKASLGGSVDVVKYLIAKGETVTDVTSDNRSMLHIACWKCHFDLVQYLVEEYPSLLQMVTKHGYSNLHKASLGGSVDVVKYLIAKGENATDVNSRKESVLHLACIKCHFDLVQYLVEENPSLLQMVTKNGYSNLHNASLGGSVDVVKYLIAKGEKVTDASTNKESVLHIACRKCHFNLVQYLVEEYPSLLQMVDNDGFSNLHKASHGGSVDVVKYLIAKGETVTDVTSDKSSMLHLACRKCHFDLVQYLVEIYPSLLQMVDNDGYSNLHNASLGGSVDVVKYLIGKGEKVTDVTTNKESVLHIACRQCHFNLVQYLVEEYPSLLQMVNNDGFSNLHKASLGGSVDVVKYLIAKGEKVTDVTSDKMSMLHIACRECHLDLVHYLVEEYPSLLQMITKHGYSNLHKASLGGSVDVVKYLIAKGEKGTDVTSDKMSMLHIACMECHLDLVQYLVEEYPSLLQMVDNDGFSNLHKASLGGSVDVVKYLKAKGETVTDLTSDNSSMLHIACRECHFDLVQYLVEENPSLLQMVNNDGFSNLHKASLGGSVDVVKYLIAKGEKVTDVTSDKMSMLHIACMECHLDLVHYLVEEYPSLLQMVDNDGYSNLHKASLGGSVDVVKYLISKGEKVTDVNKEKESVLHIACMKCHFDLVQYLVEEYPSLLQMVNNDGFSNLHNASLGGSVDVVKYLIAKGEKVTDVTSNKSSMLHLACRKCHFDLVQYLVEECPSLLQMVDNDGYSNLHNASFGGSVDVVKYLIAKGEKVTDVTSNKSSMLHLACRKCHFDLVQYLVDEYPSLLQMVDNDGFSNLHNASFGGSVDVVKYLIAKGEKITDVNSRKESVLHIACSECHFDLVQYLVEEYPSLLQMVDNDGFSNLYKASLGGSVDVVKYLIAKGETVTDVTSDNRSMLHIACWKCHFDLVQYLVEEYPSLLQMVTKHGYSNLHKASLGGSVDVVKYLIAKGENATDVNSRKESVLHLACIKCHFDLVQYLVEENPSLLQMVTKNGYSNLHNASLGGSVDVVKYLIAKGEKVTDASTNKESVLHIACRKCHFNLVQYLVEEYPSLLQMVTKNEYSNLHNASLGGSVDVVKYLIAKGEKVTDVNTEKESVLHLACKKCHFDLVQYLVEEYPSLLQMVDNDGFSNLHNASLGGSVDVVKYLIAKGEKVTDVTSDKRSMLHIACMECHLDLVHYLVEEYPSLLQMVNNDGFSNLHKASHGGSVDVVKYLIAKGETVTDLTSDKSSMLHFACRKSHFDLVQYLVEIYPSLLQMVDNDGYSNLQYASLGGSVDIVKYLIAKGEKVTDVTTNKESVLHIACRQCHFNLVQYLVEEYPSLLQMVNNDGFSNLHKASLGGSVDVVKYLIAKGEKVTDVTSDKMSMLHIACRECHLDLVHYLVEEYPSLLQMVTKHGYSNLHKASLGGSVDVVKYLIAKGEKVTDVTSDKRSMLHIACRKCHFDLVQYLVEEYPSLLQMVDNDGFSNLHKASLGGSVDVVKYLIAKGEKVTDVTSDNSSMLHIACRECHFDLVQYLVEENPSLLQMVDNDGFSNLHKASLGGSVDVVKYLIAKGEKVTDVTSDKMSMLHIACMECHLDLVHYLVEEYPNLLQMVDNAGYSNLHKASLGGSVGVVKYLIAKGEKVTDVNKEKESVLHIACMNCHFDLVQYLVEEYPSLLQMVDNFWFSNLHNASLGGSVDVVKYLIAKGEKVTDVTSNRSSMLHLACRKCHFDLVQYLVEEYPSLLQMVTKNEYSNLHNASLGGSVDVVKYLIAKGEKVTDVTSDKRSMLHIACRKCHFDLVQCLVEEYPSLLQMVTKNEYSNLHDAFIGGSVDIVKYLIAKGEKVTDVTSDKRSMLHIACRKCHFDLVQYLVEEYPCLLQMVTKNGYSNLHNASLGGSVDIVKYLIAKGEKVTDVTSDKRSMLHIACRKCHFDLVQYLVEEYPSLLQMITKNGYSNLHNASLGGSVDVVKYLIAKGEKVTDVTSDKRSMLHIACRKCHFDLVQYLVEEYPSLLQLVDNDGFSNLHNASLGGSVDVVKYLIAKGEKVTDMTNNKRSMLHIACRKCHFDLVQYLVEEYHSLLQMVTKNGYSNLHNASLGGSVDIVKYLIAKGEKITDVTSDKSSMLHIACRKCHFDLVQYLVEEYPSLLQMVTKNGYSNLHNASLGGSVEVVKYLIAKGEKVTDVTTNRQSVLHIARQSCHFDLVQYLVGEYPGFKW